MKLTHTICGKMQSYYMFKQVVYTVTTEL